MGAMGRSFLILLHPHRSFPISASPAFHFKEGPMAIVLIRLSYLHIA
jgi:hypothetical protein